MESARTYVEMALSVARELNDRSIQSEAYNVLGNVESVLGRREEALAHYDAALALAQRRETGIARAAYSPTWVSNTPRWESWTRRECIMKPRFPRHAKLAIEGSKGIRCVTSVCCIRCRDGSMKRSINSGRRWQWPETWAMPVGVHRTV